MKAEMSVAGGLRQYRRELHVLGDFREHRRKWSIEMVSMREKKRTWEHCSIGFMG